MHLYHETWLISRDHSSISDRDVFYTPTKTAIFALSNGTSPLFIAWWHKVTHQNHKTCLTAAKRMAESTRLCCWWIAHRPSENWGPPVVQCCKSKDFQWTGLNSQPSRQLLDFLCPFGPGSAHNMGPRLAGILVKIQVQLPSPVTLLLPTVSVALLSRILGV